jgi:WD40 repeat protein
VRTFVRLSLLRVASSIASSNLDSLSPPPLTLVACIMSGHAGAVLCVNILYAASTVVVSGGGEGGIRLWEPQSGVCMAELSGHKAAVSCLHSSGREILSGSRDRAVHLWDPESKDPGPLAIFRGHTSWLRHVQFKGAHLLVSSSSDRTLRVWDRRAPTAAVASLCANDAPLTCFSTSRGSNPTLVSGTADGAVKVWDLRAHDTAVQTLAGHTGAVSALHRDRCHVLSAGADGIVREHVMGSGALSYEHTGHSGAVTSMGATQTSVVTCSWDHTIRLWKRRSPPSGALTI